MDEKEQNEKQPGPALPPSLDNETDVTTMPLAASGDRPPRAMPGCVACDVEIDGEGKKIHEEGCALKLLRQAYHHVASYAHNDPKVSAEIHTWMRQVETSGYLNEGEV